MRKKNVLVIDKNFWNLEAEVWEFPKILWLLNRIDQFVWIKKGQTNFWHKIVGTGGFYRLNTLEQLKCQLEQIIEV